MLNVIYYTKCEKVTNRDSVKSIFDSLRMAHQGNEQVKENKALDFIQKYETFKMEDDETIEDIFSRFKTLVVGRKVINKGYTTIDHVKKITRNLPKKWRPIVIVKVRKTQEGWLNYVDYFFIFQNSFQILNTKFRI